MKIKSGDKVIVRKPVNVNQYPAWTDEMDDLDGVVLTVDVVHRDGSAFTVEESHHWLHGNWIVQDCKTTWVKPEVSSGYEGAVWILKEVENEDGEIEVKPKLAVRRDGQIYSLSNPKIKITEYLRWTAIQIPVILNSDKTP